MKTWLGDFLRQHRLSQSEQEQLAYMPQSVKLEEAVNPHMVRVTMIVISAAIIVFFLWAIFTKISEVTPATGEVIPRGYTQIVQHLEGALVNEVLIRDGDIVEKDQVLIKLDDSTATQALAETRKKMQTLQLQIARYQAFLNQQPLDLSSSNDITPQEAAFQQKIYLEMQDAYAKEQAVLTQQIEQKHAEIKKITNTKNNLIKSLALTLEARNIQKKLLDKGYASRLTFIEYEQKKQNTEAEIQATDDAYIQAQNALSEYQTRLQSLLVGKRDQIFTALDELKSQRDQTSEVLIRLLDRVNRLTIRSPVKGIVKGLQLNTVGGVVEPGKTLLEVVPLSATLIVEAQVSPKDVGHIKIGQPIRVKVSSYDFSRYGTVYGTLDYVSATTFLNEKREPYYKVRIGLAKTYVGNNPTQNLILPGMTVAGDIITGEKSILSYLFKPIHLSLKTAFSER